MVSTYDGIGIRFLYPENWTISDEQAIEWPRTVTVTSPSGAFWTVHVYPPGVDVRELMDEAVEAMRQIYDDFEEEETEILGEGEVYGRDLRFYCLDFLVAAKVRANPFPDQTLIWLYQAEDREFDEIELVFRAITKSMLDSAA